MAKRSLADKLRSATSQAKIVRPASLPEHLSSIWDEVVSDVRDDIGCCGLEALCIQVHRLRVAQAKVTDEGVIVASEKGTPMAHPGLEIEAKAQREIRMWLEKFGVR